MERLITGAFADILKAERQILNAKFEQAKRVRPNLDSEAFKSVLCETVAPIVESVERHDRTATRQAAIALYDISLDLLSQDFLGADSRYPFIIRGWKDLLPNIPQHVSAAPRVVVGAITNALYNLSHVPGARPQEWMASLLTLAPLATDRMSFLQAGQIAAWRAGLAHFRSSALDLCRKLPLPLARAALGLPASGGSPSLDTIVNRLSADPWLMPAAIKEPPGDKRALKIVARVGAFRGLGGLFQSPAMVSTAGEHFIVKDGNSVWLLVADCFGATFHRSDGITPTYGIDPFDLDRHGKVTLGKLSQSFPELDDWTSAASTRTTLAVTTSLSYSVFLVAATEN